MAWTEWNDGEVLYAGSLNNNFDIVSGNVLDSRLLLAESQTYTGSSAIQSTGDHQLLHSGVWTAPCDCIVHSAYCRTMAKSEDALISYHLGFINQWNGWEANGAKLSAGSTTAFVSGIRLSVNPYLSEKDVYGPDDDLSMNVLAGSVGYILSGTPISLGVYFGTTGGAELGWGGSTVFGVIYEKFNPTMVGSDNFS